MVSTGSARSVVEENIPSSQPKQVSASDIRLSLHAVLDALDTVSPSVLQHGAIGNDTADEAAAFAAANAAGPGIYIPSGRYRIASSITLSKVVTFAPGAVLVPLAGVTITFTGEIVAGFWQIFEGGVGGAFAGTIRNQFILPDWWGGKPGAASNQSPYLNWAIGFAQAASRTVYLRNGLWRCDETLAITEPVSIVGDPGIGSQSVTAMTSVLDFSNAPGNIHGLVVGRTFDFPLDGCSFQNLAIYRSALPTAGAGGIGLTLKSCAQTECINIQVWNWDVGYSLQGSATYPCGQCSFYACRSQYAATTHFDLTSIIDSTFDRCQASGGQAPSGALIRSAGGAITPNALHWTNCIFVSDSGTYGARVLAGFWINFENCVFEQHLTAGVSVDLPVQDLSLINVTVKDCWFNNTGTPFLSSGVGGNFRISDNRMEVADAGSAVSGINIDSANPSAIERDITIAGNIVKINGADHTGISVQRTSGCHIYGNRIFCVAAAAAQPGINLASMCQNAIVSQNRSYTTYAGTVGISNTGPNNLLINNIKS